MDMEATEFIVIGMTKSASMNRCWREEAYVVASPRASCKSYSMAKQRSYTWKSLEFAIESMID
jgi:hypothetical protein